MPRTLRCMGSRHRNLAVPTEGTCRPGCRGHLWQHSSTSGCADWQAEVSKAASSPWSRQHEDQRQWQESIAACPRRCSNFQGVEAGRPNFRTASTIEAHSGSKNCQGKGDQAPCFSHSGSKNCQGKGDQAPCFLYKVCPSCVPCCKYKLKLQGSTNYITCRIAVSRVRKSCDIDS